MTDSTESDHDIKKQLSVLRQAAKSTSLDEIRRQAIRTVDLVSDAVESREELQQRQINYIGSRLQSVRKEMFDLQRHLGEDSLTRVFDRGAFDETLDKFANLSIFLHEPLTLMLVDVDNLKDVNELHGREAGDDVLKTVADELVRCFPRKTDFVGRYEGDRFVVLLVDTNSATASNLAHRVLHAIRHHTCKGHDASFSITCSVGVAVLQPSENARTLLTRTEQALSRAKTNGRDQVAEG
jgi:diguanylate cyclase (GGDEF)-like protein